MDQGNRRVTVVKYIDCDVECECDMGVVLIDGEIPEGKVVTIDYEKLYNGISPVLQKRWRTDEQDDMEE